MGSTEDPVADELQLVFLAVLLSRSGFEIRLTQVEIEAGRKLLAAGAMVQFWQLPDNNTVAACLINKQL